MTKESIQDNGSGSESEPSEDNLDLKELSSPAPPPLKADANPETSREPLPLPSPSPGLGNKPRSIRVHETTKQLMPRSPGKKAPRHPVPSKVVQYVEMVDAWTQTSFIAVQDVPA